MLYIQPRHYVLIAVPILLVAIAGMTLAAGSNLVSTVRNIQNGQEGEWNDIEQASPGSGHQGAIDCTADVLGSISMVQACLPGPRTPSPIQEASYEPRRDT